MGVDSLLIVQEITLKSYYYFVMYVELNWCNDWIKSFVSQLHCDYSKALQWRQSKTDKWPIYILSRLQAGHEQQPRGQRWPIGTFVVSSWLLCQSDKRLPSCLKWGTQLCFMSLAVAFSNLFSASIQNDSLFDTFPLMTFV